MKLKDMYSKLNKETVYDYYLSICYKTKDYDNISRNKMIDSIIKQYEYENYLYHICTERELIFLEKVLKNDISLNNIDKYYFEIKALFEKCIISPDLKIYDEQINNVKESISWYKKHKDLKRNHEKIYLFIIGYVKTLGNMLTKSLTDIICGITNINEEQFNSILGNPLIHYYCNFYKKYFEFSNKEEELIYYRSYWDILDELDEARVEFGIGGSREFNVQEYYDIFYYDFPICKPKVKRMYDLIKEEPELRILLNDIRVLNVREILPHLFKEKELKIINEGLDDTPFACMNGYTPNEREKELEKEELLNIKFSKVPQINAHLCKNACDEYYKLYFGLLDYVNKKYNIEPTIGRIYKQEGLDVNKLSLINDYLFEHKKEIDSFIKENPYNFNKEELEKVNKFKKSVSSKNFVIVGFERDYTKILSEDGKIYMVKGVRSNIDRLVNPNDLPIIISTTLLMFDDKIIYNSFFNNISDSLQFGNDIKEFIVRDYSKAMEYYHL